MIELQQLHKTFGDVKAVDGLSLTARDGKITTLLGANGSGKSTTLRMLAGIVTPDSGHALIDAVDVAQLTNGVTPLSNLDADPEEVVATVADTVIAELQQAQDAVRVSAAVLNAPVGS